MANVRTYPLSRDDFFARMPVWDQQFYLSENTEVSGLADGSVLVDQTGPRLWRGSVQIDRVNYDDAREIEALLSLLQGPGRSFMVWPLTRSAPLMDQDGAALAGSSPVIGSIDADMRRMTISGLPAGYVLSAGDFLSFAYGSNPTRYALHRVVSDPVTADAGGVTPLFEVDPSIRAGATAGASVDLIRPACKAIIVPGSVQTGPARRLFVQGISFEFVQTLR